MVNDSCAREVAAKFGEQAKPRNSQCSSCKRSDFWQLHASFAAFLACVLAALSGCSYGSRTVTAPSIDADAAANKALELYDKNSDGLLNATELVACPGLLTAIKAYDTDGDQKISQEELVNRIASWSSSGPAMMTVDCRTTLDGRSLVGATIRFVPEPYFEGALHDGSGVTAENGVTTVAIAPENLPKGLQRIRAMNAGTYKVEITHPQFKIPEKYNKQTTLGREVSRQTTASPYEQFDLTSK